MRRLFWTKIIASIAVFGTPFLVLAAEPWEVCKPIPGLVNGYGHKPVGSIAAKLTDDIASNPKRARLVGSIIDAALAADENQINPKTSFKYLKYDEIPNVMKELARNGWVSDYFISELASRGLPRIRFKEENGKLVTDSNGKIIIESDRVENLSARVILSILEVPDTKQLKLGENIKPIAMNKTRVCIASFSDVIIRLEQTLDTVGQPKMLTDQSLRDIVIASRQISSDEKLEAIVKEHLANRSKTSKLSDVVRDCGFMGLRQMSDEGFRYQAQCMIVPPTSR